jgi:hypothetical protein
LRLHRQLSVVPLEALATAQLERQLTEWATANR